MMKDSRCHHHTLQLPAIPLKQKRVRVTGEVKCEGQFPRLSFDKYFLPFGYRSMSSLRLVHDLFEHQHDPMLTMEHEFLAKGAMIFTRDMDAWYKQSYMQNGAWNIAWDAPGEWMFVKQLARPDACHMALSQLSPAVIEKYRKRIPLPMVERFIDELIDWMQFNVQRLQQAFRYPFAAFDEQKKNSIREWIRLGYVWASQKYQGFSPEQVCKTFDNLHKDLDGMLKKGPNGPFVLELDYRSLEYQLLA